MLIHRTIMRSKAVSRTDFIARVNMEAGAFCLGAATISLAGETNPVVVNAVKVSYGSECRMAMISILFDETDDLRNKIESMPREIVDMSLAIEPQFTVSDIPKDALRLLSD